MNRLALRNKGSTPVNQQPKAMPPTHHVAFISTFFFGLVEVNWLRGVLERIRRLNNYKKIDHRVQLKEPDVQHIKLIVEDETVDVVLEPRGRRGTSGK